MKPNRILTPIAIVGCLALLATACSVFRTGAPPTKTEQALFNVETNIYPVLRPVTNYYPVTVYQTNPVVIRVTNEQKEVVTKYETNVVPITVPMPKVEQVAGLQTNYTYKEGAGEAQIKAVGTSIAAPLGFGGVVGAGLGMLFSFYRWVRSAKTVSNTLAQSIETMREFIKQLPNGLVYDAALTQWLEKHQAETGTMKQVIDILATAVSNPDAQIAAQQVKAAIAALNPAAVTTMAPKA